jgi:dTDP-4-dehydrorhamnose reductase
LILRISWVYAATGHNFMRTMLGLFQQKTALQVVSDQFGAPTPAAWVAASTLRLLEVGHSGVLNVAANGHCSWYQFAQAILVLARQHQVPGLQCQHITAIATSAWPAPAHRPLNSRLDLSAVEQICLQPMPDWQQGLQQTFQAWRALQPDQ